MSSSQLTGDQAAIERMGFSGRIDVEEGQRGVLLSGGTNNP